MARKKLKNVCIYYKYRDGSNYKNGGSVVVANPDNVPLAEAQAAIIATIEAEEFFIAHQVGLPELFLWDPDADYNPDDESTFPADLGPGKYAIRDDDHCYHTLNDEDFIETEAEPTIEITLQQLVKRFQKAEKDGWKIFKPGKDRPPVDFGE